MLPDLRATRCGPRWKWLWHLWFEGCRESQQWTFLEDFSEVTLFVVSREAIGEMMKSRWCRGSSFLVYFPSLFIVALHLQFPSVLVCCRSWWTLFSFSCSSWSLINLHLLHPLGLVMGLLPNVSLKVALPSFSFLKISIQGNLLHSLTISHNINITLKKTKLLP